MFRRHKPAVLHANQITQEAPELQELLVSVNRAWSRGRALLHSWDNSLREALTNCQVRNHKRKLDKSPGKTSFIPQ